MCAKGEKCEQWDMFFAVMRCTFSQHKIFQMVKNIVAKRVCGQNKRLTDEHNKNTSSFLTAVIAAANTRDNV